MKHEHFKLLRITNGDLSNDKTLNDFLNSGIQPKSISVDRYYGTDKLVLIGYLKPVANTNSDKLKKGEIWKKEHEYHIVQKVIDNIPFVGLSNIGSEIEQEASKLDGVICQDVEYLTESILLTFLTTK